MLHFRPIPFFGAVAALLLTGCYDSRFGEPDDDGEGKPATETIAALRDRYAGTPFTVTGDIVVTGRVASCDRAENFYRTLCICDAEAGLEVMAGIDHLHNDFPIGSRVTLSLRGLAVAESRGVLQAGRPPAAGSGRRYARFADAEVPAGTVSLTGILQYDAAGDGRYILKLRDENDCTH